MFVRKSILGACIFSMAFAIGQAAMAQDEKSEKNPAQRMLDKLKTLEGKWILDEGPGEAGRVAFEFKVTSVGLAVMEVYDPGLETEELTVYYVDGDELAMTHFCSIGSQAHMRTKSFSDPDRLSMTCAGPSNVDSEADAHMHRMALHFVDDSHIESLWVLNRDNKTASEFAFKAHRKTD